MDINYNLVGKILKRYQTSNEDKVKIFLTSPGYQKGIGDHNCWVISNELQVPKLIKEGLFKFLEPPIKHPSSPQNLPEAYSVKIYQGNFILQKAKDWYKKETLKRNDFYSKHKWIPDLQIHKGELILPNKNSMSFHSGNFGGLNELFQNFGHDVTTEDLRNAIHKHTQSKGKTVKQINLSSWMADIVRKRKPFSKYFQYSFFLPNKHRLSYKD